MSGNEPVKTLEADALRPEPDQSEAAEAVSPRASRGDAGVSDIMYLGNWLGGLRAFLSVPGEEDEQPAAAASGVRLLRGAIARISEKTFDVQASAAAMKTGATLPFGGVTAAELSGLADRMRALLLQCDSLSRRDETGKGAATAFRQSLLAASSSRAASAVVEASESLSAGELPTQVMLLADDERIPAQWKLDLRQIVGRIAVQLGCLRLIGEMLERDEPLKSSVILFARVEALTRDLTGFISSRLDALPDDSDALFASLDAAAYTTQIELKKVYGNELKGIAGIRPTPLVYARVETAYSLLNDSLQMTLANLVRLSGDEVHPAEIFPDLLKKERESVILRERMWDVLKTVKQFEHGKESVDVAQLVEKLKRFRDEDLVLLYYKDRETVERFVEELSVTKDEKEFGALVHRFGAYLETLFRQVNMRVVLSRHPFPASPDEEQVEWSL